MFEVPLDLQLEPHLESFMSNTLCLRLKAILKEMSDVICHCCHQTALEQEATVRAGEAVGCQLA
jgi:hypothetical protein